MSELDAQLVGALGLTPAARRIRIAARDAELAPTSRLGTETVARLLGLRLNHPQGSDDLELLPSQPATRAEAAYSFARALSLSSGQVTWLDQLSQTFSLPELNTLAAGRARPGAALRRLPLRLGRHLRGDAEDLERHRPGWLGHRSGWIRLLRASSGASTRPKPFPGAPMLGDILKGRTTYAMSGEVKKPARIGIDGSPARRRRLLRRARAEVDPARGRVTRGSTSATAGSSTRQVPA